MGVFSLHACILFTFPTLLSIVAIAVVVTRSSLLYEFASVVFITNTQIILAILLHSISAVEDNKT
jgi:hypothetical protein